MDDFWDDFWHPIKKEGMKSVKINNPSPETEALYWVKENGRDFWRPVKKDGRVTSTSKFSDSDILDGLFCGHFSVNDEKLEFKFIRRS
jgi:hypothetical protein